MKKLKYFLFLIISSVLAFSVARVFSPQPANYASGEMIPSYPILSYVSLSYHDKTLNTGKTLTYDNLKVNGNTYYIFSAGSISINFQPLNYNYRVSDEYNENFTKKITKITIPKDEAGLYERHFEYNGRTYFFSIVTGTMYFYYTEPATSIASPMISTDRTSIITYVDGAESVEISITESYTLKSDIGGEIYNFPFSFSVYTTPGSSSSQQFNLMFTKPAINFLDAPVAQFDSFSSEWETPEHQIDDGLMPEQSLTSLKLTFLNNKLNYSEETPLYFNINYNGFVYNFSLFIKEDYLFVNYVDENNLENNKYLATKMVQTGVGADGQTPVYGIDANGAIQKTENFSMTFNKIGRYFIEIFDDTYSHGMGNDNYYQTSFYIKEQTESGTSDFDNMYIVSQVNYDREIPSAEPEGEPTYEHIEDYIVGTSTQNHPVRSTIKNLLDPNGTKQLKDSIKYVLVGKTLFGANNNITDYYAYIPTGSEYKDDVYKHDGVASEHLNIIENLESLKSNDEVSLLENGDMQFNFSADGYYQIIIVSTPTADERVLEKSYTFFIVTTAKANYTIAGVKHEATADYVTQTEYYDEQINNRDNLAFTVNYGESGNLETNLNKTYINHYSVSYGRQKVNVAASIGSDSITITCQGIGELSVEITFNDETTTYTLNSEEGNGTLTFYDYGTYKVALTDSMGTYSGELTFTLSKKLNTSSLVLIILSSVILLVIVTFVLVARAKPKTR